MQDAFVKAYSHLASFREELPFEVWFTRILINGCLDRIKARTRRERWLVLDARAVARAVGLHGARRGRRPVARGSGARARAPAEAGRRARAAARAAALGVHAEPLRGLHVAGSQRADGPERVDGSRAPVSRDPQAAHAARRRRRRARAGGGSPEANVVSILSRTAASTAPGRRRHCGTLERRAAARRSVRSRFRICGRGGPPPLVRRVPRRATTPSPAGWTTRAPRRSTKPTRSSRPNAWLRSRRRFCAGSKRSNVRRGSSPFPIPPAPEPLSAADRSAGLRRPPPPASSSASASASCWTSAGASSGASAGHLGSQPIPLGQSARRHAPAGRVSARKTLFLYDDSDAASTSPSVEALQALDALTPRVRDLDQVR